MCSGDHESGQHAETVTTDDSLPEQVVTRFLQYWIAKDIDACLTLLSATASYTLHIEQSLLPFAGTTTGREEIGRQLAAMLRDWDYLVFRPTPAHAHVDDVSEIHSRVEFMYRHRASGEVIDGFLRLVWCVREGLITEVNEYHDAAMVETFLRLLDDPTPGGV